MKRFLVTVIVLCASIAFATPQHNSPTTTLPQSDICQQAVNSHPEAYCGGYVDAEAEARAIASCGDCRNLSLYAAIQNTKVACQTSQENSNSATSACGDAALSCGDVSNQLTCPPTPECPDLQPACAQWIYRYTSKGTLKSQKCKRWVVPVAYPSN